MNILQSGQVIDFYHYFSVNEKINKMNEFKNIRIYLRKWKNTKITE